ncbi:MAG: Lrp/AsnC family transcriptional regulator [Alphaproteobacteria bacterium]|nr:Lrp/AsnC family transcriptional regulator [Alphaproteobacteria bacterium]
MLEIDAFDRKILALVQADCRQTTEAIGAEVGLSPTAVQRRLKRLRAAGAIRREIAVLDGAVTGNRITLIVHVTLTKGRGQAVDGFKARMRKLPEVQQCFYTMGESDFVLIVTAKSVTDYEAFTRRALFDDANVAHFKTTIAMDTVKTGLDVPLD